jgi:CRISPR-associated endonuclease/helicase Cas3
VNSQYARLVPVRNTLENLTVFNGHSENIANKCETLSGHLERVASRAERYATLLNLGDSGRVAGILHDLGKYGERFQARLLGKETGIDHWSIGAASALEKYRAHALPVSLVIEGHHTGLSSPAALRDLPKQLLAGKSRIGLRFSQNDCNSAVLLERLTNDGFALPEKLFCEYEQRLGAAFQLDVRMLFSALVDADFIETESHFRAATPVQLGRDAAPELRPERLLTELRAVLAERSRGTTSSNAMRGMREKLQMACEAAAVFPAGLFSLGAPTGSGKTLGMLRFALEHAAAHPGKIGRIVVVVPYLSILEQTAAEYRALIERAFPGEADRYMLEHHSLADTKQSGALDEDRGRQQQMLSENWEAPFIVTTSVQFLESLHANRPGACRKLHRLANTVVLMDEVQTIPRKLAILTLATLSRLSERFGTTVVLATATQPAFDKLHEPVQKYAPAGWRTREIAPEELGLFKYPSRIQVKWPESVDDRLGSREIAAAFAKPERQQCLCIVNVKAHAIRIIELLADVEGVFHLSTNMCPKHREKVLSDVRKRLIREEPCRLISTQCVEAGVDLDFPEVWRALGPLEAIAQAAGRCNRHGLRPTLGKVHVFRPAADEERYPDESYKQAARLTENLLRESGILGLNLEDPDLYRRYYGRLYAISDVENFGAELINAIHLKQFDIVAEHYRLIDEGTVAVVVPYNPQSYETLARQARGDGLNREWIRLARPLAVNLYRPKPGSSAWHHLEPVRLPRGAGDAPDWFLLRNPAHYTNELGLLLPKEMETLYV